MCVFTNLPNPGKEPQRQSKKQKRQARDAERYSISTFVDVVVVVRKCDLALVQVMDY